MAPRTPLLLLALLAATAQGEALQDAGAERAAVAPDVLATAAASGGGPGGCLWCCRVQGMPPSLSGCVFVLLYHPLMQHCSVHNTTETVDAG